MFFVELRAAPHNKDIYEIEYLQECKIKFQPPKHERDIEQCVAKDIGTKTLNQVASNVPVII
jgi:hypothetical protein